MRSLNRKRMSWSVLPNPIGRLFATGSSGRILRGSTYLGTVPICLSLSAHDLSMSCSKNHHAFDRDCVCQSLCDH
jgi:hypothetical protein